MKHARLNPQNAADLITSTIEGLTAQAEMASPLRQPLTAFVPAGNPQFADLRRLVNPAHVLPHDLLPGARSVVSFFLPFSPQVVAANAYDEDLVASEWAVAYVQTNALIDRISASLIDVLERCGVGAAAEPATYNFDPVTLVSRWSHKSVAVVAGLGSFGVHHLVITRSGCAGRFGSLVLDVDLPYSPIPERDNCTYCMQCVQLCPIGALDEDGEIDKQSCWIRCQEVGRQYQSLGLAEVCGKCSIGPCALESPG